MGAKLHHVAGRARGLYERAVNDLDRLLFAVLLGVSATAAMLVPATMARGAAARALTFAVLAAWLAAYGPVSILVDASE